MLLVVKPIHIYEDAKKLTYPRHGFTLQLMFILNHRTACLNCAFQSKLQLKISLDYLDRFAIEKENSLSVPKPMSTII